MFCAQSQEQLDHLFSEVYKLADDHFGQLHISDDIFDGKSWQHLARDRRLAGIPLSSTNSPAAKWMRSAAVLRLIALAAFDYLFQPVYLTGTGWEVGQVLQHLYALDRTRAQWVRSVLLSVDQKSQAGNGNKREKAVVEEVFGSVGFLLSSSDGSPRNQNTFRKALQEWCTKTRNYWMELQQLEERFIAIIDQEGGIIRSDHWKPLPDKSALPTHGVETAKANGTKRQSGQPKAVVGDIMAQIWPVFYLQRGEDPGLQLFKRGYVLDETQVAAAQAEVNRRSVPSAQSNLYVMPLRDGVNTSTDNINSFLSEGA